MEVEGKGTGDEVRRGGRSSQWFRMDEVPYNNGMYNKKLSYR